MTDPKRKPAQKSPKPKTRSASSVRDGGTRVSVQNSGLEVWLYDDANIEKIRETNTPDLYFGGMPAGFENLTRDGFVVGYSLCQDDEVNVAVYVGEPFTDDELEVARWLEPQHAFLRSEATCRFYTGLSAAFAVILALEGSFEVFFVSELEDGAWVVTGLADEIARKITSKGPGGLPRPHPLVRLESMDESLSKIFSAHKSTLKKLKVVPAPASLDEAVATCERFGTVAFGPLP